MGILAQPHDRWYFTGTKLTYGTFNAAAAVEGQSVDPPFTTDLADTGHGLLVGTTKQPSLLYIEGTDNYNGLRQLISLVGDSDSLMIAAKYTAETIANTDTWKAKVAYDRIVGSDVKPGPPWEFLGFYLTLSTAPTATSENFDVYLRAAIGSTFDNRIYRKAIDGITHINYILDKARPMDSGDKIDFVWLNADSVTWGLTVFTRRLV